MRTKTKTKTKADTISRSFLNPSEFLRGLEIQVGGQAADFGCGAGYFTIPLARLVGDHGTVHAVDVRGEPLEALVGRAKLEGLYNIRVRRADLEVERGSGLPDGSQEAVVLANILFQVKDREAVVREAHRVLKPGGRLVAVEWHTDSTFGPSLALRPKQVDVRALAESVGFKSDHTLEAGAHHFALIFRK